MNPLLSTLLLLGLMAAVVYVFRSMIRRPAGVSEEDPPGVRTTVAFSGDDPELFREDDEAQLLVGISLFRMLCDGLAGEGIEIVHRGTIQNAQAAECVVAGTRHTLVLERVERRWVANVDWAPQSKAEKRHLALTHQVFAPPDTEALRRLLLALDRWLKGHPKLSEVRWYRKERWIAEDLSSPSDTPIRPDSDGTP